MSSDVMLSEPVNKEDHVAPKSMDVIIRATGLSKSYIASKKPGRRMWELLLGLKPRAAQQIASLSNVSFEMRRGDRLGIVGENGAGKSTLLKMLCGVLEPSEGTIEVNGRVSALLELGAGFNPDLTGIENIQQFCRLHGMNAAETEEALPEIMDFSELGETINMPIRSYSSGEGLRLGFSCAVHVRPDILVVDEALSVGDSYFQVKCLNKIKTMLDDGVTFIYVTHAPDAVRSLCNKGLWLEKGVTRMWGDAKSVSEAYQADMFRRISSAGLDENSDDPVSGDDTDIDQKADRSGDAFAVDPGRAAAFIERVKPLRSGDGTFRILDVMLMTPDGEPTNRVAYEDDLSLRIVYEYRSEVEKPVDIGVGISDSRGVQILHHSTLPAGIDARSIGVGGRGVINIRSRNLPCPGSYSINVGMNTLFSHPTIAGKMLTETVFDLCVGAEAFEIVPPDDPAQNIWGILRSDYDVSLNGIG